MVLVDDASFALVLEGGIMGGRVQVLLVGRGRGRLPLEG
jgi:hypothetical protein